MKVTKEDVISTAELLHINLKDTEIETLTKSFTNLIDYFKVLDAASAEVEDSVHYDQISRLREDHIESYANPDTLIAKSEEHEDNFVLIPNVL